MNPKYTRTGLIAGISGLILQIGCYALVKVIDGRAHAHLAVPPDWVAYALLGGVLVGSVLLVLAICDWAKAKGYSFFLGLLLGFMGFGGLFIIAFLPDLTSIRREEKDSEREGFLECPSCRVMIPRGETKCPICGWS